MGRSGLRHNQADPPNHTTQTPPHPSKLVMGLPAAHFKQLTRLWTYTPNLSLAEMRSMLLEEIRKWERECRSRSQREEGNMGGLELENDEGGGVREMCGDESHGGDGGDGGESRTEDGGKEESERWKGDIERFMLDLQQAMSRVRGGGRE